MSFLCDNKDGRMCLNKNIDSRIHHKSEECYLNNGMDLKIGIQSFNHDTCDIL